MVCQYCFFNHWLEFQDSVCNGCHDLTILCLNINDTAVITVKGVIYCCIIHDINKSEATRLLENFVFDNCRYIQNTYQRN